MVVSWRMKINDLNLNLCSENEKANRTMSNEVCRGPENDSAAERGMTHNKENKMPIGSKNCDDVYEFYDMEGSSFH